MSMIYEHHDALLAAGFRLDQTENRWMKQPFVGSFRVLWYWYLKPDPHPMLCKWVIVWQPYHEGHWSRHEWKTKRVYGLARARARAQMQEAGVGPEVLEVAKVLGVCS